MNARAYWRTTKPGIVRMVMMTAGTGWLFAQSTQSLRAQFVEAPFALLGNLVFSVLGIGLGAAGACVLNNLLERETDAHMERTRHRELVTGVIPPGHALGFGLVLVLGGVSLLFAVNLLCAFLVLLSAFLYVVVYTPLKRMTWLNTSIGAIPGALPIACGWVAVTGRLDFGAWVAFAILYAWQHPHFYAIAWMYRKEYGAAGFRMLSVTDPSGTRLALHILLYSFFLIAVSILPSIAGGAGWIYAAGALLLGLYMLQRGARFAAEHSFENARGLLRASLVYLPAMLAVLALDFAL